MPTTATGRFVSRRAAELGTENAFVVLAEVGRLQAEGNDVVSFCIRRPISWNGHLQKLRTTAAGSSGDTLPEKPPPVRAV